MRPGEEEHWGWKRMHMLWLRRRVGGGSAAGCTLPERRLCTQLWNRQGHRVAHLHW